MTNTTFWTMDIKTGKLSINFVSKNQPVDLTGATVLLGFYFENGSSKLVDSKDGSIVIENAEQGRCRVMIPSYRFDYSGPVLIHVYILYDTGERLDCATVATEFERSWLDQELPEMEAYYVKRIEDWLSEIETETNEIKEELEARLADLRQDIINAQTQANHIQAQIHANNIVTQSEFNDLSATGRNLSRDSRLRQLSSNNNTNDPISQENLTENGYEFVRVRNTGLGERKDRINVYNNIPLSLISENLSGKVVTISHKIRFSPHFTRLLQILTTLYGGIGTVNLFPHDTLPNDISLDDEGWQTVSSTFIIPTTYDQHTGLRYILRGAIFDEFDVDEAYIDYRDWSITLADDKWSPAVEEMASKQEMEQGLNKRLPLTGGTLTGDLIRGNVLMGSSWIGTHNDSNFRLRRGDRDIVTVRASGITINTNASSRGGGINIEGATATGYIWAGNPNIILESSASNGGIHFRTGGTDTAKLNIGVNSSTFSHDVTAPNFRGRLIGNADTATRLATPRTINGVAFDGSTNITIAANPAHNRITTGADFNTLLTAGFYDIQHPSNRPPAVSGQNSWWYVIVQRHNDNYIMQTTTDFNHVSTFRRVRIEGEWRNWVRLVDENHIHDYTQVRGRARQLTAGTNLNNLTEGGTYRVSNPTNSPVSNAWVYLEVIQQGGVECMQRLTPFTSPWDVWIRSSDANGVWRPWGRIRAEAVTTQSLDMEKELEKCKQEVEELKATVAKLMEKE